jgi:hypothetical protein
MVKKWLIASSLVGCLISGHSKANVIYTFFDLVTPSTIDLEFQTTNQLSLTNASQPMLDISGALASDFAGGTATYAQGPSGFQPTIRSITSVAAVNLTFTDFPFGDSANGVPGNGSFSIIGEVLALPSLDILAVIESATISGVPVQPVAEPASLALLLPGLGLLGLIGFRVKRSRGTTPA